MRCVVTGGAGFIGSTLTDRLVGDGHEVVAIDVLSDYYDVGAKLRNVQGFVDHGAEFVHADLNTVDLAPLLDGVDAVFHLAGQPGVRKSWGSDFAVYSENNVNATQRLLEACVGRDLKRFVYSSSSSVYGRAERYPTLETDLPAPFSPYGVTKLAGEHLAQLYGDNHGVPTVSFRFFTVYGPRQRPDMAFARFLRAAVTGEPISIYGDGRQVRDFTYVGDVVDALLLAALPSGDLPRVMNLAGGTSISVADVLDLIEDVSGSRLDIRHLPKVDGDVPRTGGSIERATAALGWTPATSLRDGLSRHLEWVMAEQRAATAEAR